jgi:hypothetical protein
VPEIFDHGCRAHWDERVIIDDEDGGFSASWLLCGATSLSDALAASECGVWGRSAWRRLYQVPRTSDPHPQHKIYPYLLRHMTIERPNHVWCAEVTYIPMRRGFLYLFAIMDWRAQGSCLAAVEHDGGRLLPRGAGGGRLPNTANPRSSKPIRVRSSPASPSPTPFGAPISASQWTAWALDGQRLHRAPVAVFEVRVRVPPSSRRAAKFELELVDGSPTAASIDRSALDGKTPDEAYAIDMQQEKLGA